MRLDKLTQSPRDPNRFEAEFQNGESLTVTVALIADYSLYSGCELDEETYEALKKAAADRRARERALRILGRRSMSRRELTERLTKKGEDAIRAEETADWLTDIGALDDAEYAAMIVRHYSARGYGAYRIRDELYRRGIDRELWEDALSQLPDMEETAYEALKARLKGERPDKAETDHRRAAA